MRTKKSQRENIMQQLLLLLNAAMQENLNAQKQEQEKLEQTVTAQKHESKTGRDAAKEDDEDLDYAPGSLGLVPMN